MNTRFDPDQSAYYRHSGNKKFPVNQTLDGHESAEPSFFFYDLETSGVNPREDRIMQFAGQRTTLELETIGKPVNLLVKLNDDTLPSPEAIVVTNILPQDTVDRGINEAEFCRILTSEIFTPNTIVCGYNSVRFDDEHMRYLFWRNFYDPYEWQWRDGRSRWDLLDVVRMVRALRPEGIIWPVKTDPETGKIKPVNKLELLSKMNKIDHTKAHDALSDVEALIALANLIKEKQPRLFEYLLKMRDKKEVQKLVNLNSPQPFVYTSGRYKSEFLNTTVAFPIAPSKNGNVVVFNLRYNLEELLEAEQSFQSETKVNRFGQEYETWFDFGEAVKELCLNKCPAVAPLSVLDALSETESLDPVASHKAGTSGWEKIGLDKETIEKNLKILLAHPEFIERMRSKYEKRVDFPANLEVEASLYDAFLPDVDRKLNRQIQDAGANELADFNPVFLDERLPKLFLHFKARNFKDSLSEDEQVLWETDRMARIERQSKNFWKALKTLEELSQNNQTTLDGREIKPEVLEKLKEWYKTLKSPT